MKIVRNLFMMSSFFLLFACSGSSSQGDEADSGDKEKEERKKEEAKNADDEKEGADTSGVTKRGESFDPEGSMAAAELPKKMEGKDSLQAKIHGKVQRVCQKKGCWMEIDMGSEHPKMMVRFKDYEFFVPKDASGSHATMKGWAHRDTFSVKKLKHYAKDKGKSQEAIDSIQEPEVRLAFKASGVRLEEEGE